MTAADFTLSEMFWAAVVTIALLAVVAMLWLGVWAVVQKVCADDAGPDVLGDGGRRLD